MEKDCQEYKGVEMHLIRIEAIEEAQKIPSLEKNGEMIARIRYGDEKPLKIVYTFIAALLMISLSACCTIRTAADGTTEARDWFGCCVCPSCTHTCMGGESTVGPPTTGKTYGDKILDESKRRTDERIRYGH